MSLRTRRDFIAAPPDDGGSLGIFGTPEDAMQVDITPQPGSAEERTPTLDDPSRTGTFGRKAPTRGLGVMGGTLLLAVISAVIVLLAMLVGRA